MEGSLQEKRSKKGSLIKKTWDRCKSIGPNQMQPSSIGSPGRRMVKSKSWSNFFPSSPLSPRAEKGASPLSKVSSVTPKGCLSVYVGPDKQKFIVKIECTNHPLFRMLLEEAEMEYGYHSNGPLTLPCEVDLFLKVLHEMDVNEHEYTTNNMRCSIPRNRSSYHLLNPSSNWVV